MFWKTDDPGDRSAVLKLLEFLAEEFCEINIGFI